MIEIRPMTKDDLGFVADLEKALFSDAWSKEGLAEELNCPYARS